MTKLQVRKEVVKQISDTYMDDKGVIYVFDKNDSINLVMDALEKAFNFKNIVSIDLLTIFNTIDDYGMLSFKHDINITIDGTITQLVYKVYDCRTIEQCKIYK